ncbi:chorismate-binding protein [Demequina activiva]|uniref:Anthranilate synthase n=1 Tax=Demequina activiva TaxID=1582364 RepID=A0A919Q3Q5_9MICO|nr:chorismate-binding protein [Demequina activiva]GIG54662.1 anthranilate synthase [Demequina activiva]
MDPGGAGHNRASAEFRGVRAHGVLEHIDARREGHRLAEAGFWVVVGDFDGRVDAWRMAEVERDASPPVRTGRTWSGPEADAWASSLTRDEYLRGVERIREDIRDGDVYQVNLCRMLSAPMPAPQNGPDAVALSERLALGNPARYASRIVIPRGSGGDPGAWIVSASPELYLAVDGDRVRSSPIKGTAAPGESMLDKDVAENVMITDLVRNDLSHVARPGSVRVPELLAEHDHPGLTHLESTVEVTLADDARWTPSMWRSLLDGTFPPGSVSGAPKSAALRIIAREETAPRGPYCGAIGWVDADARTAELAVGIRTFWWRDGELRFGTGAGITWGSDPEGEWRETELKARRLIALASAERMQP